MSAQKPKTDLGHHHDDKVRLGNLAGLDRGRVREHVAYGSSSSRRDKEPTSRGRRSVSQSASGARFLSAPVHALEDELLQRRGADVELILQLELERGDLHTCAHKGAPRHRTERTEDGGRRGKGIWRERRMSSSRNERSVVRGTALFPRRARRGKGGDGARARTYRVARLHLHRVLGVLQRLHRHLHFFRLLPMHPSACVSKSDSLPPNPCLSSPSPHPLLSSPLLSSPSPPARPLALTRNNSFYYKRAGPQYQLAK